MPRHPESLVALSDNDLIVRVRALALEERRATTQLIAALAEFERRQGPDFSQGRSSSSHIPSTSCTSPSPGLDGTTFAPVPERVPGAIHHAPVGNAAAQSTPATRQTERKPQIGKSGSLSGVSRYSATSQPACSLSSSADIASSWIRA